MSINQDHIGDANKMVYNNQREMNTIKIGSQEWATMTITKFEITETRHMVVMGECTINGCDILFSYIPKTDKFVHIGYNVYDAKNLPETHNQMYLVGREIAKHYKSQTSNKQTTQP